MAIADISPRVTDDAPQQRRFGIRPRLDGDGMAELVAWVDEIAELTQPDRIHWVDGSRAENDALLRAMQERRSRGRSKGRSGVF